MPKTRVSLTRKLFATATAALALLTATGTTPAQAATPRNGICETGEVCFYYNSNFAGSVSDFTTSIPNYGTNPTTCYVFQGPGNGQGKCIKNEVASVVNKSNQPVTVYYNSNYAGATQVIPAGQSANLNPTLKNNNASHKFGAASAPAPSGSWARPVPPGAQQTADWYYSNGTKHGAVDWGYRGDVYSACTGTVDSVKINGTYANRNARGVRGSTNYVWINCGGGIRMGYAHFFANQLPSHIKVGYQVKAGEYLFPVGNQGNSTGYHLHFEVRQNGTQIHPLTFLRSKGVNI